MRDKTVETFQKPQPIMYYYISKSSQAATNWERRRFGCGSSALWGRLPTCGGLPIRLPL
jgi:hypothetical protein